MPWEWKSTKKATVNLTELIIQYTFISYPWGLDFKLSEGQAYSDCYRILQDHEPHHTSATPHLEKFSTVRSLPLKGRRR